MRRMSFASTLTCWVVMTATIIFDGTRPFSQTFDGLARDVANNPIPLLVMEAVILGISYALFRLCRAVLRRAENGVVSNLFLLIGPAAVGFTMAYCFGALIYHYSTV